MSGDKVDKLPQITKLQRVTKYLNLHPDVNSATLYDRFPTYNQGTLRNYLKRFKDISGPYVMIKKDILNLYMILLRKVEAKKKLSMEENDSIRHIENWLEKEFGDEYLYGK